MQCDCSISTSALTSPLASELAPRGHSTCLKKGNLAIWCNTILPICGYWSKLRQWLLDMHSNLQDGNLMLSSATDQELREKLRMFLTWNSECSDFSGTNQVQEGKPALNLTIICTLKMVKIHSTEVSNTAPKSLFTAVADVDDREWKMESIKSSSSTYWFQYSPGL